MDVELPTEASGYVYTLVYLQDKNSTYIGETTNLCHRLQKHNSGLVTKKTADITLRPWALLGFVCGFGQDRQQQRLLEGNMRQITMS
jgi:predicted GIY-YIG superfamily endonuclease